METGAEGLSYEEETLTDAEYLEEISLNPRVKKEIEEAETALTHHIPGQAERHKEIRRQMERLLAFSQVDGLTGLKNQEGFKDALGLEMKRMGRLGASVALLMIDLDWFKRVNDEYGHPAGDAALRALAEKMRELFRTSDTLGRLGGDELGIVLPAVGVGALVAAHKFQRQGIAKLQIPGYPEANGIITASIGIAISGPEDTAATLYERADQGTLWTKKYGKSGISVMGTPGLPFNPPNTSLTRTFFVPPNAERLTEQKGRK